MLQSVLEEDICFTTSSLRQFLRSLQYGIVVIGVIDAFVYARTCHRSNTNNPGNFGDSMEGRIRLMTAITPTYAHAYQSLCLVGRLFVVHHQKLHLLSKLDSRIFLTLKPRHVKKATTSKDGAFLQMVVLASLRSKLQLGRAPSPALLMEGLTSCFSQLSQLMHISCMQEPDSIPTTPLNSYKSNKGYDLLCSTSTVMRRIPGRNVQTMLPLSYALVGCTLPSIPLRCLRHVTTLMTSCRYYAMPQRHKLFAPHRLVRR